MSFLAPLFLIGAAAVAAPIIFHLIRRTSREKTIFSSLMFLQATPPRVTRRSRLENIFLLILRCLVLGLLALGFSRPFLQRPFATPPSGQAKKIVVLVDTSASMRRENLWQQARAKAEQLLRAATPADSVALMTFDQRVQPLIGFEQWNALSPGERVSSSVQRLAQINPGWHGTHLGNALISAVEALEDANGREKETAGIRQIIVISDLQEGAHLEGVQGYEWPRGVEFILDPVKPKKPANAGLQLVMEREESDLTAPDAPPRIRISNSTDSDREQFKVGWLASGDVAFASTPIDVYVPPGQNSIFQAPPMPSGLREQRLALVGDDHDFDNGLFIVPPRAEQIPVLYLGDESARDSSQPLYYLRRAFQQTRMQSVQILVRTNGSSVMETDLAAVQLAVVSETMNEPLVKLTRHLLDSGKTVVFPMKSAQGAQVLSKILGSVAVGADEASEGGYAMLEQIDFQHPLFAPFDDPRFNDFTKIHFWKHRRIETNQLAGAKILARFDKGDPAILQMSVGKGTLLILTSGWHPSDSQLALSSKFVPMLYSLLQESGSIKAQRSQYVVGDTIPLPAEATVQPPGGVPASAGPDSALRTPHSALTEHPGIYTASTGKDSWRFAVNLPPDESKTAAIPVEELQRLGLPLKVPVVDQARAIEQKKRLQNAELEARQKLWRWLILATLVVLMLETWVAGLLSRRATLQPATSV
jgi:hypothetical protein